MKQKILSAGNPGRRRFLGIAIGAALSLGAGGFPGQAVAAPERELWLVRPAAGESVRARYVTAGEWHLPGYAQACWLLRDVQATSWVRMDPRLLDLLFAMQQWIRSFGFDLPIVVHSGYRSPRTNAATEGAALNSLHLYGKAVDISFPGLPAQYVAMLAQRFGVGGVGLYVRKHFVHVDVGRVRSFSR